MRMNIFHFLFFAPLAVAVGVVAANIVKGIDLLSEYQGIFVE